MQVSIIVNTAISEQEIELPDDLSLMALAEAIARVKNEFHWTSMQITIIEVNKDPSV